MSESKFERGHLGKYSLGKENELDKLSKKYKIAYDNLPKENKDKPKYDRPLKQHF